MNYHGIVISTDDEEAKAPEEERRDPEHVCVTTPIQGVLPKDYPWGAFHSGKR